MWKNVFKTVSEHSQHINLIPMWALSEMTSLFSHPFRPSNRRRLKKINRARSWSWHDTRIDKDLYIYQITKSKHAMKIDLYQIATIWTCFPTEHSHKSSQVKSNTPVPQTPLRTGLWLEISDICAVCDWIQSQTGTHLIEDKSLHYKVN